MTRTEEMIEYVPIKEFAQTVGVSTQAVYKRLNTDLKPYATVLNGEKRISTAAFKLFQKNKFATKLTTKLTTKVDEIGNQNNELIAILKKELEHKNEEIENLHSQNKFLQEQLKVEREHSRDLSDKLVTITDQAQRLHLADLESRKKLQEGSSMEEPEEKTEKKSIFRKIFG